MPLGTFAQRWVKRSKLFFNNSTELGIHNVISHLMRCSRFSITCLFAFVLTNADCRLENSPVASVYQSASCLALSSYVFHRLHSVEIETFRCTSNVYGFRGSETVERIVAESRWTPIAKRKRKRSVELPSSWLRLKSKMAASFFKVSCDHRRN